MRTQSTPLSLRFTAASGLMTVAALLADLARRLPPVVPGCLIVGAILSAFAAIATRGRAGVE